MYQIDNQSRHAVYQQIVEQVETYLLTNVLQAGDRLPSVRSMSIDLHVNPNTVQRAYQELENKGLIETIMGRGSFISKNAFELLRADKRKNLEQLKRLLQELQLAGVSKNEVLSCVKQVYQ